MTPEEFEARRKRADAEEAAELAADRAERARRPSPQGRVVQDGAESAQQGEKVRRSVWKGWLVYWAVILVPSTIIALSIWGIVAGPAWLRGLLEALGF
jgi:hypothetical protein